MVGKSEQARTKEKVLYYHEQRITRRKKQSGHKNREEELTTPSPNHQNLRGQTLLFRCLETGFVTTAPALCRYQSGRGIDPSRRELVGERPATWIKEVPTTTCEHCGMVVKGNQWAFRQHQQTKRCQKAEQQA
jgi:hypothetical protein